MPAIQTLMKRLGFVKLSQYGLVLTPEGRIMSLRPAILDDGLGGKIVGWPDNDLAAMELQQWEPARPAAREAVATRVAVPPPPLPLPRPAPAPVAPAPVVVAPAVAQPEQTDEDEWEWEIALARARVAAEEAEAAAASVRTRARLDTIPPPPTSQPRLAVVRIPPRARTEPITTLDFEDQTTPSSELVQVARIAERPAVPAERPAQAAPIGVRKPAPTPALPVATIPPKAEPAARVQVRPGTAPPTVIPIPKLPSVKDRQAQIQPVISAAPTRPTRTRFAKGTGPVPGPALRTTTHVGVAPPPPVRPAEDTSPGLPPVAAAVSLPSVKRLARSPR